MTRRLPYADRWALVAFALLGLLMLAQASFTATIATPSLGLQSGRVGERILVTWVQPDGIAWNQGVRPGDVIAAINRRPATTETNLDTLANATSVQIQTQGGAPVTVEADVAEAWRTSLDRRFNFFTLAVCFTVVGAIIYVLGDDLATGYVALGLSLAAATALIAAIATPFGVSWALNVEHVAVTLFCTSVFLLFLVFPVNRLVVTWGRVAAFVCLGVSFVLIGLYVWALLANLSAFSWLEPVARAFLAANFVGAAVLALYALLRRSTKQKKGIRPALALIVLGILAGLAPFYLLSIVPLIIGSNYLLNPDDAILSMVLLPIGLGAAVLSRQFPGITRLVRRSLVALAVWTTIVTVYTVGLYELYKQIGAQIQSVETALPLTALVVAFIGATFAPAQSYLRRALERALFHDIYNYAQSLQRLSTEIARLDSIEAVSQHVLTSLAQMLDLSWAAIAIDAPGATEMIYRWGASPERLTVKQDGAKGLARDDRSGAWVGDDDALQAPLWAENAFLGMLIVGPKRRDMEHLPEDQALVATLAPLVATALQNALLTQSLERQVASLEDRERELAALTVRLMQAQEEERRRIALDLHDDPLQRAILLTRDMSEKAGSILPSHYMRDMEEIAISLRAICTGLRPPMLDDLGLVAALKWLVSDVSARSDLSGSVLVEGFESAALERLEADLEVALYRVALEALTNCLKHAQATHVWVLLQRDLQTIQLRVVDDGRGPSSVIDGEDRTLHFGILGMCERLRPWGGVVQVTSTPTGGTLVAAVVEQRGQDGDHETSS